MREGARGVRRYERVCEEEGKRGRVWKLRKGAQECGCERERAQGVRKGARVCGRLSAGAGVWQGRDSAGECGRVREDVESKYISSESMKKWRKLARP